MALSIETKNRLLTLVCEAEAFVKERAKDARYLIKELDTEREREDAVLYVADVIMKRHLYDSTVWKNVFVSAPALLKPIVQLVITPKRIGAAVKATLETLVRKLVK